RMTQQLEQVEESSRQRLELEKELDRLRTELTQSRNSQTALNRELETARQQADPDYERMEQQIREQVASEYRQRNRDTQSDSRQSLSRAELINELSGMDPMEMAQLMTLQGRYGAFLESLNVDIQRKEIIIDALGNYLNEQNNARRDLMMQARVDGFDRNQLREQMEAVSSPEARHDALSYALTDEELQALDQFEQSQPQNVSFRAMNLPGGDGTAGAVFIGGGDFPPPGPGGRQLREVIITTDQ
ncbi:MAG: hypothetical protein RL120_16045, partial [Gammaproteobacteria bacterium]